MKRIAFVGTVGAGKTTLFNALQGNYSLARKTQAVEFSDAGNIDTPGEFISHPRLYCALINTLIDAGLLIYVHAANDSQCRIPAGLLDIYRFKMQGGLAQAISNFHCVKISVFGRIKCFEQ